MPPAPQGIRRHPAFRVGRGSFAIISAVAFSRSGDPATGDFGDATVIRKFGDVPDDLSAL
jgi:hypothetical protein